MAPDPGSPIKRLILIALAAFALSASPALAQPNVLVIVTDDQTLESMDEMEKTALRFNQARGNTTFSNAYATTPLCCPSRASIFSGQYVHNHGIDINDGTGFDDDSTWQRYLHDAGYRTGIVGKYLNRFEARTADHFDFRRNGSAQSTADATRMERFGRKFIDDSQRINDDQPWALYLAPFSPHGPYTVEPETPQPILPFVPPASMPEPDKSDKHSVVSDWDLATLNRAEAGHFGKRTELQAIDESITSIFARIRRLDEQEDLLAIFVSDNGFQLGAHDLMAKRWPYLESVRVPMLVAWPDSYGPMPLTDDSFVANIDIAPTILEAAGVQPGYVVDGRSMATSSRSSLFLESDGMTDRPSWRSIVSPARHYIRWDDGFVEDYDRSLDPYEMAASNVPDQRINAALRDAADCRGATCP